jgi:hypothetical protein
MGRGLWCGACQRRRYADLPLRLRWGVVTRVGLRQSIMSKSHGWDTSIRRGNGGRRIMNLSWQPFVTLLNRHWHDPEETNRSADQRLKLAPEDCFVNFRLKTRQAVGASTPCPRGADFSALQRASGCWRFDWLAGFRMVKRHKCRAPADLRGGAGFPTKLSRQSRNRRVCQGVGSARLANGLRVGKPAIRQTWKSAVRRNRLVPAVGFGNQEMPTRCRTGRRTLNGLRPENRQPHPEAPSAVARGQSNMMGEANVRGGMRGMGMRGRNEWFGENGSWRLIPG